MEKVGILVVSYGSREAAMVDAFSNSQEYEVELFIVDKQRNPFNAKRAKEHVVIPSLAVSEISRFARKRRGEIDFGIVGPEKPIIDGIRDVLEDEVGIPLICPKKAYAIEASKVKQRKLFQETVPEVNPRFKVFDMRDYATISEVKEDLFRWLDDLNDQVVVKPDAPAAGKGVGVWGDHFNSREQLLDHFLANLKEGPVIVEEKLEGEESSFQAMCDGKHLIPLPETRDHKRAFDGDKGPNTGGMGSYKDKHYWLPFMTKDDWEKEIEIVEKIFNKLKGKGSNRGLLGVPFYVAFIHTRKGPMVLENNSRPGDPEIINILPILKDDFVDICFRIIEGSLTNISIERKATVAIYKVPPNYGGYATAFPDRIRKEEIGTPINFDQAEEISKVYKGNMWIYPASVELREDGQIYPLTSRAVCVVGAGDSISEAREIAWKGLTAIKGGALWSRTDIATEEHIRKSILHMKHLRQIK
ncbi:MAG: hypothetical protein RMJ07_02065 [Nitrososphaerota archaeon]|nr:hypothetical protein [Nitrososphaerota archaeon]